MLDTDKKTNQAARTPKDAARHLKRTSTTLKQHGDLANDLLDGDQMHKPAGMLLLPLLVWCCQLCS